jgi:hypothetical protein
VVSAKNINLRATAAYLRECIASVPIELAVFYLKGDLKDGEDELTAISEWPVFAKVTIIGNGQRTEATIVVSPDYYFFMYYFFMFLPSSFSSPIAKYS